MNVADRIIQLAKENNGVVTTAILSEKGILRGNLKRLQEEYIFCRKHGKMNL